MPLIIGFVVLGLLIGDLVGLSASSAVMTLLPLLFALAGSSVIALLSKLATGERPLAGWMIIAISVGCLAGVNGGIATSEWHLLGPNHGVSASATTGSQAASATSKSGESGIPALGNKYLRSAQVSTIDQIDSEYRHNMIDAKTAYDRLYLTLMQSSESASPAGAKTN